MSDENIVDLLNSCLLPSLEDDPIRICNESDFEIFRAQQAIRLSNVSRGVQEIRLQQPTTELKIILKTFFLLLGENNQLFPWNNASILDRCNSLKKDLIVKIFDSTETTILDDGLKVKEGLEMRPLFKVVLLALRPKLLKQTWKRHPAAVECFAWLLRIVRPSSLTGQILNVLPTSLLLVDDYFIENRVLGVNCIALILENMTIAELKFHGYGQLIYKALERVLRERDASVVQVVIPCMLNLTCQVEGIYNNVPAPYEWSQMDDLMETLLEMIQVENRVNLRYLFIKFMPKIIESISHKVYRWTKRILNILDHYLEVAGTQKDFDGILDCLKAFRAFVTTAEATRNDYCDEASFLLLRTIYHISETLETVEDVKPKKIITEARLILEILFSNLNIQVKSKFKNEVLQEVNKEFGNSTKLNKVITVIISSL